MSARLCLPYHKHAREALKAVELALDRGELSGVYPLANFSKLCFDVFKGKTPPPLEGFSGRLRALVERSAGLRPDKRAWLVQAETVLHLSERLLGMASPPKGRDSATDSTIEVHRLRQRNYGTYSTPNYVVDCLVRRVFGALDPDLQADGSRVDVFDLSAEAGHFALSTLGLHSRPEVAFHALDRDPEAVALNRVILDYAKTRHDGAPFQFRSRLADSVIAPLPKHHLGTIDAVIGNPPWKTMHPTDEKALAEAYEPFLRARFDVYLAFILRADQLLRPGGILGLVLPSAFLYNDNAESVRSLLLDLYDPIHLGIFPRRTFIELEGVAPIILILKKKNEARRHRYLTEINIYRSLDENAKPATSIRINAASMWRQTPRSVFSHTVADTSLVTFAKTAPCIALSEIGVFSSGAKLNSRKGVAAEVPFLGVGAKCICPFHISTSAGVNFEDGAPAFDRSPPTEYLDAPKVFFQTVRCIRPSISSGSSLSVSITNSAFPPPSEPANSEFFCAILDAL